MTMIERVQIDTSNLLKDEPAPSGGMETFSALLNANFGGPFVHGFKMEEDLYDARNDAIEKATGQKLFNPLRIDQGALQRELATARTVEDVERIRRQTTREGHQAMLFELQQQHPEYASIIRADTSVAKEAGQRYEEEQQRAAAVAARYPYRLPDSFPLIGGESLPSMAGGLASGFTDPFVLSTLPLMTGRAAAGASGVLWAGLRSAAANAAGSAIEQPFVAAWRHSAGLEHTVGDAAREVLAAAAFGFLADVGVRGVYRGGQRLLGREPIVENGVVSGYRPSDPRAQPLEALDAAGHSAPEGSVMRRAAELDPDALREVAKHSGLENVPEIRGALEAMARDQVDRVPPVGVAETEHISRLNDAVKAADDPRALPHGDAIIAAHSEEAGSQAIREMLAKDPVQLAAEIRDNPEILKMGLPWNDAKLRAAAHLSRLDDGAFDMVAGGEAHPLHGAIVAEHVADADRHAGLLRQLAETNPKTPQETRARLAELLAGPKDEATHARVAGISDDLADRPVVLVDDPHGRDATRQLEQLRREHAAEIEAATGAKPAAGGRLAEGVSPAAKEKAPAPVATSKTEPTAAHDRLVAALDKAIGRLPEGVEIKSFRDVSELPEGLRREVLAAQSAGRRPKALYHPVTTHIWIAQDALMSDLADQLLSHETLHALRHVQRIVDGKKVPFLADAELQLLADKAVETRIFTPDLRAEYDQLYRARGLSEKELDEYLKQEAAAHLIQARAAGINAGREANEIIRRIKQFLERAKNALQGLGFQNADDIMKAIDDGVIAARARRDVEMPGGGEVEGVPLFSLKAYHSTDAKFDTFDRDFTDEVGFHFGSKMQARDRAYIKAGGNPFKYFRSRIIEADIDIKKPAVISRDITSFDGETLGRQLVRDGIAPPSLLQDLADASPRQKTQYVRDWLVAHGYDGVKYVNAYEGPGESSVMALGTGNVKDAKTGRVLFALKAYHGTPHEVDRFRSDRIGTGEGAQAFGHGLYFAESEAVARQYRDALAPRMNRRPFFPSSDGSNPFAGAPLLERDPARSGHIYQVDIDVAPDHFIDWDKPLDQQSDYVRNVLKVPTSEALQQEASKLHNSLEFLKRLIEPSKAHLAEMRQIEARLKKIDPHQSVQWKAVASTPEGAKKLHEAGVAGIRYLDGASRVGGEGTSNYVIFDDSKIKITHVDGEPVTEPSQTGGALFSLRDDAREHLKADLEEAAAMADAKAKAQRERQALIDEGIRKNNERFVTTLRDARGQVDPAKALVYLLENHGQVDLPQGMTSVAAEQKAVEAMAKAGMEELLHEFRPQLGTGKTRSTARLTNVIRELSGEGTGDASAKGLAQAWSRTHERLRQEFNAAGGDIPKLEGWFLPQVHDRAALLAATKTKWVSDIYKQLDLNRILDGETRQPLSPPEIRAALGDIWENITSDGHGTQAANAANPFEGITGDNTGAKKLANQRQEHRFLHFKSADAWLDYQKQYGGGADPFRAMMQHITSMSKDIAAMRVLGTNPNRELARLAKFAAKQAALARPAAVIIDEAVAKVQDLTERYLAAPTRLTEVNERIGAIHKQIAGLREKRMGPPSKRNKRKIEGLRDELFRLDTERLTLMENGRPRVDGLEGAELRLELQDAYDELAAVQDVDKVLFPKKTEILGKTMTRGGFWTTAPEDYARAYINRAEAMWDLYRGTTSAPVNVKAAQAMQTLRNVGVIGRGGSMVISSIADNFTQVMARRFTGLPAYKTFTDILAQLGPNATREAHRQALIGETYLHMFNDGARGAASVHGAEWSNYLAERTIALQGLGKLTDAQRQGFGMSVQAAFADLAEKSFAEIGALNPRLQKLLVRYGIDAADWDAIRLNATTKKPREVDFLSPNLVRDDLEMNDPASATRRVAERYLGMILQETDFASPTAMLRARAVMVGKTRPGTLVGELLRTGGQFKSFSVMYWMLHAERALREGIANGALKGASYAAQVVMVTTLGGALVVQLKDLKGGKDLRPVDRPGFWYAALMQGGGLGIWGDLFNSEQNRFGGGLVSTVSGPVVGIAEDVMGAAGLSSKTTAGRGQARLATSYVPGSSLWYLNLAWQRIAAESLQRQLDPMAYDAFRRRQESQMRDYGNGFWWAPGQTAPGRGPRVN